MEFRLISSLLPEAHSWLVAHWDQEAAWETWPATIGPATINSAWAAALLLLNQTELQQHLLDAQGWPKQHSRFRSICCCDAIEELCH